MLLLLFTINFLWGLICAIPTFFVVGFTLEGWFPPSYQHPDNFFPPSRGQELWMLTLASAIFILYYLHLIAGAKGFVIDDMCLKKYSSHFQRNILITLIGLGFMFYHIYPNLRFVINGQSFMWAFFFTIPISSLIISIRGFIINETIISSLNSRKQYTT